MSLLQPLMAVIPTRSVTRLQGVVVSVSGSSLSVNVNGNVIPARYLDPTVVAVGDPVAVDFVSGASGQAEAWVAGRLASSARPATGTVATVPPGSATITVTGSDGQSYTAYYVTSYTPTVNDAVVLHWNAGTPTVVGKASGVPAAKLPSPVAPPPAHPTSGTSNFACIDSSTYGPTGWGSWGNGNDVYQGQQSGSGAMTGAWFYGSGPSTLSGRTINAVRLTLGGWNGNAGTAPVTVNVWTHLSSSRPSGLVSLGSSYVALSASPNQGPLTYNLPTSFATDLLNGGGIALNGDPYAGFYGRNTQPHSGLLSFDWSM